MNIDSIHNGFVIDHIPAGRGMKLYDLLDDYDDTMNVFSNFEIDDTILEQM